MKNAPYEFWPFDLKIVVPVNTCTMKIVQQISTLYRAIVRQCRFTHRYRRVMMMKMTTGSIRMSLSQFSVFITASNSWRCTSLTSCSCSWEAVSCPACISTSSREGGAAATCSVLAASTGGSGGPQTLVVCRYLMSGWSVCGGVDGILYISDAVAVAVTDSWVPTCNNSLRTLFQVQNFKISTLQ